MEDCSTDERLQQETLCRRQWTDEYVERPETLIDETERNHRLDSVSAGRRSSSHRYAGARPFSHFDRQWRIKVTCADSMQTTEYWISFNTRGPKYKLYKTHSTRVTVSVNL